jgi:hypothetical protein
MLFTTPSHGAQYDAIRVLFYDQARALRGWTEDTIAVTLCGKQTTKLSSSRQSTAEMLHDCVYSRRLPGASLAMADSQYGASSGGGGVINLLCLVCFACWPMRCLHSKLRPDTQFE